MIKKYSSREKDKEQKFLNSSESTTKSLKLVRTWEEALLHFRFPEVLFHKMERGRKLEKVHFNPLLKRKIL